MKWKLGFNKMRGASFICMGVLLVFAHSLVAQPLNRGTIKGKLVNEQQAAISHASILLKNSADSLLYRTIQSNEQGTFSFNSIKAGNYFLEISIIGFKTIIKPGIVITDTLAEIDMGTVVLQNASKTLGEVVVQSKPPLIERHADKTVVNVENSIIGAGTTALEMMEKLPGVQVTPDGQIRLNGKSGVTVYIDGKAMLISAEDLAGLLRGMSSSAIQKIEIMTNPSAKFEASGGGGVINIVKKKNRKEGVNGSVGGGFGQGGYSRYNGNFLISYKNKYYNLVFSNSYIHNKQFFTREITTDIFDQNNSLRQEQVSVSNAITTTKTYTPSLGIDFYLSNRTSLSFSGTGSIQSSNVRMDANMDELDKQKIKTGRTDFSSINKSRPYNYMAGLHLAHQFDSTGRAISVDMDYSNYWTDPYQTIANFLYDTSNNFKQKGLSLLDGSRKLDIYAAKADYSQPLKGNALLEFGWKSSYVKAVNNNKFYNEINTQYHFDSSQSDYTINKENINALYVNLDKKYKKVGLQAALRAEQTTTKVEQLLTGYQVKRNYFWLFPSLSIDYKINDKHELTINTSRRASRPSYASMIPFRRPLSTTTFFKGNPNLVPEILYINEIKYNYQNTYFVTFAFDFHKDYISIIPILDDNKVTVTRTPSNIRRAFGYNVDLAYSKDLAPWWSTNNSFTFYYQRFKGTINDVSLNFDATHSFLFSTNNSFVINKSLSAECSFSYQHKNKFIGQTENAYSSLDLGIRKLLFNKRATIAINTNNILQSQNRASVDRYVNLVQYWYLKFDARVVRVNFTYRFGKGKAAAMRSRPVSDDEQRRTRISN